MDTKKVIWEKGDEVIVNHTRKGQFLATVAKDFDATGDVWADLKTVDGEDLTVRIEFCKFKEVK